jgi:catechol 2,3-dioxygenase-like lactoylglutathione lyase family enzyme
MTSSFSLRYPACSSALNVLTAGLILRWLRPLYYEAPIVAETSSQDHISSSGARPENAHHAFEVEDFDTSMKVLEEHGISIERSGVRHDGPRYLFIRIPDGNRVELCTPSGF